MNLSRPCRASFLLPFSFSSRSPHPALYSELSEAKTQLYPFRIVAAARAHCLSEADQKPRTHCSRRVWMCFRFLRIPINILIGIFCDFLA